MMDNNILILNQVINGITLYVPYFTIIVGTIGSFCNLLTFTSRQLRRNSCALYFLCSTIFDLIYLTFGASTRLMSDHYSYILPRRSVVFCKVRTYLAVAIPALATFFLTLASVDRCLLTSKSRKWRRLSCISIARHTAVLSVIFWLLCFCHMIVYYDLQLVDVNNNIYTCMPRSGAYTMFISVFILVCNTILFYIIMFAASVITLRNVRTSRHR
ncbi:unnamed protein product, partial [Rotaria sp. Silwood2]